MHQPRYLRLCGDWHLVIYADRGSEIAVGFSCNWRWRQLAFVFGWLHVSVGKLAAGDGGARLRVVQ